MASRHCAFCHLRRRTTDQSARAPENKAILVGRFRVHRACLEAYCEEREAAAR